MNPLTRAAMLAMILLSAAAASAEQPANAWVQLAKPPAGAAKEYCDVWYMPGTDEFLLWGKSGGHRYVSTRYDVETLRLADESPAWHDSLPAGKEQSWAGGMFPNWGCGCHRIAAKPACPWSEAITDRWFGTGSTNQVRLVETDGVARPTRVPTFHQGAYDSKRDRMLYFAGGATFAYDPKTRTWTDLKAAPPLACDGLIMAAMAYDPVGDQAVLFGGCFALNPWGGARTWVYDCATNRWRRPELAGGIEPPLRCNVPLVYDAKNKVMVLAGGDAQSRFLADTWVFDPAAMSWTERKPAAGPPPLDRAAACYVAKCGLVFLVTPPLRVDGRDVPSAAWTYDAAADRWTAVRGTIPVQNIEWVSCDYSPKADLIVLHAPGVGTWTYRLDPATAADENPKRPSAAHPAWVWNARSRTQMTSILAAPPADRAATGKKLADLPPNTVLDSEYPGVLTAKTWSGAAIDTDRGVVVYTGGGHSGYKGNDIALYDVGANRWSFQAPPDFIPLLYNYNACLFGWTYGFRPTSQHTYMWYAYDPASKTVVYCPRPHGIRKGMTVLLEDDPAKAFAYDPDKHGPLVWIYRPSDNRMFTPATGRPFEQTWDLALRGTPKGLFARASSGLYHGTVTIDGDAAKLEWKRVGERGPVGQGEFQPVLYDAKRDRLVAIADVKDKGVQVWTHPTGEGAWEQLETAGEVEISREAVYDTANDCILMMAEKALYALDLKTSRWRQLEVPMPDGRYGTECAMEYDPVHKVSVLLIPKSFSGKLGVYLFRYDPATAKYAQ